MPFWWAMTPELGGKFAESAANLMRAGMQRLVSRGAVNQPVIFYAAHDPGRAQSARESNNIGRGLYSSYILAAQTLEAECGRIHFVLGSCLTIIQKDRESRIVALGLIVIQFQGLCLSGFAVILIMIKLPAVGRPIYILHS
jgi:hypothetical protein